MAVQKLSKGILDRLHEINFTNKIVISFAGLTIIVAIILGYIQIQVMSQQGSIILQQTKLLNQTSQLLNQSVKQGEPYVIPTGYCEYQWRLYGGYNQTFSLLDIGKTPGIATLSYSSSNMFPTIYQNVSVGIYSQNTILQVIPNIPLTFKVQAGDTDRSVGNRSYLTYSIKIRTNGTTFGTLFNRCYVLTCSYTNATPMVLASSDNFANIYFRQIKNQYLYNATQYDNGYFYSSNETWVNESPAMCNG